MEKRDGPKHHTDAQKGQKKPRKSAKENKDAAKNDVIPIDDTQVSGKTEGLERIRRKKDPVDADHFALIDRLEKEKYRRPKYGSD